MNLLNLTIHRERVEEIKAADSFYLFVFDFLPQFSPWVFPINRKNKLHLKVQEEENLIHCLNMLEFPIQTALTPTQINTYIYIYLKKK